MVPILTIKMATEMIAFFLIRHIENPESFNTDNT